MLEPGPESEGARVRGQDEDQGLGERMWLSVNERMWLSVNERMWVSVNARMWVSVKCEDAGVSNLSNDPPVLWLTNVPWSPPGRLTRVPWYSLHCSTPTQ